MSEGMMTRLFAEMDKIAHELRTEPHQIPDHDQTALRQLQKRRHPDLTKEQWLALFTVWGEHDKARRKPSRRWRASKFIRYRPSLLRTQISWRVGKTGNR
jgi:hypothetical protein